MNYAYNAVHQRTQLTDKFNTIVTYNYDTAQRLTRIKMTVSGLIKGERITPLKSGPSVVTSVAFSPDGKILAAGLDGGTVAFWDPVTGESLGKLDVSRSPFGSVGNHNRVGWCSVAFSPDGKTLATASGTTLKLWDVGTVVSRKAD